MSIVWIGGAAAASGAGGWILAALLGGFLMFGHWMIMQNGECEPVPVCLNCADYIPGGGNGLDEGFSEVEECEGPVEPPPT